MSELRTLRSAQGAQFAHQTSMYEPEEVLHDKSSLFWRRSLVLALYLSFAVS